MKFKSILLPFDGSEHSINAANCALDLAKSFSAKVTVVHCYEWHGNVFEVSDLLVNELKANMKKESANLLRKAGTIFENQDVEFRLESVPANPGFELRERAKSGDFDLIIMGSHGHSDIAGLFLGSVTHKVLNRIFCPVMVVP